VGADDACIPDLLLYNDGDVFDLQHPPRNNHMAYCTNLQTGGGWISDKGCADNDWTDGWSKIVGGCIKAAQPCPCTNYGCGAHCYCTSSYVRSREYCYQGTKPCDYCENDDQGRTMYRLGCGCINCKQLNQTRKTFYSKNSYDVNP
jgi:hypothetical protein